MSANPVLMTQAEYARRAFSAIRYNSRAGLDSQRIASVGRSPFLALSASARPPFANRPKPNLVPQFLPAPG